MSQVKGEWLWSVNLISLALYPFSWLFYVLTRIRLWLYKIGYYSSRKPECPVVVVGNLSVGGNGKTPVVISLIHLLRKHGFKPGVISRGYKSQAENSVGILTDGQSNDLLGDEANMVSEICACPIATSIDRPAAAQALFEQGLVDIIISDDGLQHYALKRDIEIVVKRDLAMGNQWCLPAGPLREPLSRLNTVDMVINRDSDDVSETIHSAWNLAEPKQIKSLDEFKGTTVHAIAGIGFPDVFFKALKAQGLTIIEHFYPDHYDFVQSDLEFNDQRPILMTHKDAVKIRKFDVDDCWVVSLEITLSSQVEQQFLQLLKTHK